MDSGEGRRQDEIISLCQQLNRDRGPFMWPCKGSSSSLPNGRPYRQQTFDEMAEAKLKRGKKARQIKGVRGFYHITVNTPFFQSWIHRALHYLEPGKEKSLTIPIEAAEDEDLLRQLVNEQMEDTTKKSGHIATAWVVVDESTAWDFRDAVRYARCAGEVYTRGAWKRLPKRRRVATVKPEPNANGKEPEKNLVAKKTNKPGGAVDRKTRKGFVRKPKGSFAKR